MASECKAKDRSKCRVHGTGGIIHSLTSQAHAALAVGDTSQFFRLKEEIANLPDDELDTRRDNFFNRVKARLQPAPTSKDFPKSAVTPELAHKTLTNYFASSLHDNSLTNKVLPVLNDPSKSTKSESSDASIAAEEVYGIIWDDFSEKNGNKNTGIGGRDSAKATIELFHRMNRTKELGWIEAEAPSHLSQLRLQDVRAISWVKDDKDSL